MEGESSSIATIVELFRRCRNICRSRFDQSAVGPLIQMREQRSLLLGEIRRLNSITKHANVTAPLTSSPIGVLGFFRNSAGGLFHCELLLAQHDHDITALLSALFQSLEVFVSTHNKLKSEVSRYESSNRNGESRGVSTLALESMRLMVVVCAEVISVVSQSLATLRKSCSGESSDTVGPKSDVAWWRATSIYDFDGSRLWQAAEQYHLDANAEVLVSSTS